MVARAFREEVCEEPRAAVAKVVRALVGQESPSGVCSAFLADGAAAMAGERGPRRDAVPAFPMAVLKDVRVAVGAASQGAAERGFRPVVDAASQ